MNAHKRETIQKLIVQESGADTLDLNDIVLGYEGARIVAAMVPQFHTGIRHLKINGNNIDSEGFQLIFTSLLHCPHLKSIEAEWNNIGSSEIGLAALCHIVKTLQYLEYIDLKNNRIGHHLAGFIAEIVEMNRRNLKVIDLRWNDIGELGAKAILSTLGFNKNIKFLGLEDNRISTGTLMEIQSFLRVNAGIGEDQEKVLRQSVSQGGGFMNHTSYPISGDEYMSMDCQVKAGEIRGKIDIEQKEAQRHCEKMEVEIQKILNKIKLKGAQFNEMQSKYDSILLENQKLTNQLREAERILSLQKQRAFSMQRTINQQKSNMRAQKYKINSSIQNVMQKFTQRNQRELEELEMLMNQKLDRLNSYLKQRLHDKRSNREKLSDLKEDVMKFKLNKEELWNKGCSNMSSVVNANLNKGQWEEEYFALDEMISSTQSTIQAESKKGDYMSGELNTQIIRALKKQQKLEDSIFTHQNKIKSIHNEMALKNIEIEKNLASAKLQESKIFDRELALQMQKGYLKYVQSQSQISVEIENMKQDELNKANRVSDDTLDIRIADVERALRAQQAQNKMIKNQYEKMMSQLETVSKKSIQMVLFQ